MKRFDCELAILGAGFGGTLLAIIAQKLGRSVVLIERGKHPRFAIGESSTPLSNFKLARIAKHFDLDWLMPFARYGTWKASYPEVTCGLKRGFSFFRHEQGKPFRTRSNNDNALLVSASPDDSDADTQWLRAEFDAHVVSRAIAAGVPCLDECEVHTLEHESRGWELNGTRHDGAVKVCAKFLVDASGTGQALAETLRLQQVEPAALKVRSRALYSHFTRVALWQNVLEEIAGTSVTARHPYRCDASTIHHVIDGGWMWVIRFDGGVTSAGFSLDPDVHPLRANENAEGEWHRLVNTYPALARQFANAEPIRPFVRTNRLQRRLSQAAGGDWAMLPHTAGFLDAWLSPGIAQTLFAVNRLGRILAEERTDQGRERRLHEYNRTVIRELAWVDEITGTCFACFDRFPILVTASMLYFVAAIYGEERERTGQAGSDEAFLLADDTEFRAIADRIFRRAASARAEEVDSFRDEVRERIAPYNLAGLCDPLRHNLYPFTGSVSASRFAH